MPKLRIEGLERDLEAQPGQDVRKVCIQGHVNLFWSPWARLFNCRGIGLCGACPVRLLEANGVSPRTKKEEKRLANKPHDWRLACQTKLQGDMTIEAFPQVSPEEAVGAEAVRRAQMEESERGELLEKEKKERLEARQAVVSEVLADKKKRRSKLFGFIAKRIKKTEGDEGDKGDKKPKKEKKAKKEGGLAGRLRKKKAGDEVDKKPEKKTPDDKEVGSKQKKGFKLGKGGKKREERQVAEKSDGDAQ
jgi:ferredoxin